ncbi:hypothetical protein ACFORO_10460 [Amycolatopsis halotolerans]|uniref:Chromosome partition protein Smc n=1 Tax=Amycolatopsis halotolerans TaxID=330083 RepID=A0ABV7QEI6_9PSEU
MTEPASTAERAVALDRQVQEARGEVERLGLAIAESERTASDARKAVDLAGATAADEETVRLRGELSTAQGALKAWEEAHRAVSAERSREAQAEELARHRKRLDELQDEAARTFADVRPTLDVLVDRIEQTEALERELHGVRGRVAALAADLDGSPLQATGSRYSTGPMIVALERNGLLRDLVARHRREGWHAL